VTAPIPDRVLTQNALTGEWLATALPLIELEYGDELSGPGSLSGRLSPRLVASNPAIVDPGTTLIYVESAGQLQWGGLVWDVRAQGSDYASRPRPGRRTCKNATTSTVSTAAAAPT
jgi:hypothetical protein